MTEAVEVLLRQVTRHLAKYGVHVTGLHDAVWDRPTPIRMEVGGRSFEVTVLVVQHVSTVDTMGLIPSAELGDGLFIVSPNIRPSTAAMLRAKGLWFADAIGNAYLHGDGLHVDVRGRRVPLAPELTRLGKQGVHDAAAVSPFTPRRAQVGLVLLSDPEFVSAPFREIADRAGVSVGMAKNAIDSLIAAGFVEDLGPRRRVVRASEFLDLWASTFPSGLGRASTLMVAGGDLSKWLVPRGVSVVVSGEQAVEGIVNPQTLILYVDASTRAGEASTERAWRELLHANRWHNDPQGNVLIRKMFWHSLDGLTDSTAPPAIVYADLLAAHEPRQRQVAHELRDHVLARL